MKRDGSANLWVRGGILMKVIEKSKKPKTRRETLQLFGAGAVVLAGCSGEGQTDIGGSTGSTGSTTSGASAGAGGATTSGTPARATTGGGGAGRAAGAGGDRAGG